jgi:hypothetical protein
MKPTHRLARAALSTAAFAVLAGAASLSWAQAAEPNASPAKKELVQKLLQLQQGGLEGLARTLAQRSVAPIGQQADAFLQNRIAPEQREALVKEIQAEFGRYGDDVGPLLRERVLKLAPGIIGPVLEEKFSEDELKQVIAAMESPGFRKYMQVTPELQNALGQKLVADTQAQVEPKIKALEQTIAKKLNAASTPAPAAGSTPKAASTPKPAASGAKK